MQGSGVSRSFATIAPFGYRIFAAVLICVGPVPVSNELWAELPLAVGGHPLPSLAPVIEKASPAVVNIATESRVKLRQNPLLNDPFFRRFFGVPNRPTERKAQSLGSGVIVDAERGLVLTNNHVVANANQITVQLEDGRKFEANVVGTDPETDVAVIEILAENLIDIPLADSDVLRRGDFVVAIGNPFGLEHTVTSGIVSALGRSGLGIGGFEDYIQTDASINLGNSGGALVNLRGELIGINTAIFSQSGGSVGIGFAIPANMAKQVMEQLVAHGEVKRGFLGVRWQDLGPEKYMHRPTRWAFLQFANADGDGTKAGYDLALTRTIADAVRGITDGHIVLDLPNEPGNQVPLTDEVEACFGVPLKHCQLNRINYLVEVENAKLLRDCKPDFDAMMHLSSDAIIITAAAKDEGYDYAYRYFAPQLGIDEDPVTGSANCVLAEYWCRRLDKRQFTALQPSKHGGVLHVELEGARVCVSGKARTAGTRHVSIDAPIGYLKSI